MTDSILGLFDDKKSETIPQTETMQNKNQLRIAEIASGQSIQSPVSQSITNMTNTFNLNGTVREEADITKIGNAIADRLQMAYINQGSY